LKEKYINDAGEVALTLYDYPQGPSGPNPSFAYLFRLFREGCCEGCYRLNVWWRWGELNPRPKTFSQEVYMLSKGLLS